MRLIGVLDGSTRNMRGIEDFLRLNGDRKIVATLRMEGAIPDTIVPGSNGAGMDIIHQLARAYPGASVDLAVQPANA